MTTVRTLVPGVALFVLAGCTLTSLLISTSGDGASATVEDPILPGATRLSVVLDGRTYTGKAGEGREDTTGEQAHGFGWDPGHEHPFIKQEAEFLFGSTTLEAADGARLECDHLRHGDDWRLRCRRSGGGEVQLQRARE